MSYTYRTEPIFEKNFAKITKKDKVLREQVLKKINEICEKPFIGKPLRNVLKGKRNIHIGSYVIIYMIEGTEIVFLDFAHHDYIERKYY